MPKPPAPLYPDVPWWAVLISAFVFSLLGILIGVYVKLPGLGSTGIGTGGVASLLLDTMSYIPHVILLFGVLADMFTLQGVWSIPSLVGLLSVFANYVFQYFWKGLDEFGKTAVDMGKKAAGQGAAPAPAPAPGASSGGARVIFTAYDGCTVQGLEAWNSPYAPQTFVVTATVFSYYCFDLIRNRGWVNSSAAIVAFLLTYIAEVVVVDMNTGGVGCMVDGKGFSTMSQGFRAFFEGLFFGGVSYAVVQTYAPNRLPSSTISPFPSKSVSELSPGPDGRMYDKDGYPYVVLPNGMAVPDLSDAKARTAFGLMASKSSGTATTLGSDCPGASPKCPQS